MSTSRFLRPTSPGGLLSQGSSEFTPTEELTLQNISNGTYFVENETPTGTVNGINTAFTTANAASPVTSLEVSENGQLQALTSDYSYNSGTKTITFVVAPPTGTVIRVNYRRQP